MENRAPHIKELCFTKQDQTRSRVACMMCHSNGKTFPKD
jgi:hypothetical protein